MSEKKRGFYEIKADMLSLLKELKQLPEEEFDQNAMAEFLASFLNYTDKSSDPELAEEIFKYQYQLHGSFKQNLYRMMYGADENNLSLLHFVYPKEIRAFKRYGRTGLHQLSMVMERKS